ncbi:Ig-like domain-containing protein [Pseudoalteromonas sp. S16_S37]|uniref:Ig-like domain-containing protein n=1 Tax=Pseudoalteromonas sp. S16_S37 TaxID=2720228 RepID=UPI0016811378|nr:Ig-like domain-containing protein [Pseudoalteromonas sp. S16_S37]MBD1582954.1 hypothetical protein [Pseudoalteromonas sp. S16_S37]
MKFMQIMERIVIAAVLFISTISSNLAHASNIPLSIVKPAGEFGVIQSLVYNHEKTMVVIDSIDNKNFLSVLDYVDTRFVVSKRLPLPSQVSAFVHYEESSNGHIIAALGMISGEVALIDVTSRAYTKDIKISDVPIETLTLKKQLDSFPNKLLSASAGRLTVIDLANNYNLQNYEAGAGAFVQGSFSQANAQEFLFADGSIYTFTETGLSKVGQLNIETFTGIPIYAFDDDSDGFDEVLLQSSTPREGGEYQQRHLALFNVKKAQRVWFSEDLESIKHDDIYNKQFHSLDISHAKPVALFSYPRMHPVFTSHPPFKFCTVVIEQELKAPTCYERGSVDFHPDIELAYIRDFDSDGKLDILQIGRFKHGTPHSLLLDIINTPQHAWDTNSMPMPDNRCNLSLENALVTYNGQHTIQCRTEVRGRAGHGRTIKYLDFISWISLTSNELLESNVVGLGTWDYHLQCDEYEFVDELNGNDLNDRLSFRRCGGVLYSFYANNVHYISVWADENRSNGMEQIDLVASIGAPTSDLSAQPNKLRYSSASHGLFLHYPSGTWFYGVGEGITKIDNEMTFVDIAYSAIAGKMEVLGLGADGALYVLKNDGSYSKQLALCEENKALSINELSANSLVYSCDGVFGAYDTLTQTIVWKNTDPNHWQKVFFQQLEGERYLYTSSSDPRVYRFIDKLAPVEDIAQKTLSVHVRSALDITLSDWFSGQHYVFDHQAKDAQLVATDVGDGSYQYQPAKIGKEYLDYKVINGQSEVAHGSVIIEAYNTVPVANLVEKSIHWRGVSQINLLGQDDDNEAISYEITTQPQAGRITEFDVTTGLLKFDPMASQVDLVSFTYRVADPSTESELAQVLLKLTNSEPVAQSNDVSVNTNQTVTFVLKASDSDGDPLTFHLSDTGGIEGLTLVESTGEVTYKAAANMTKPVSFEFYVNDGRTNSKPQLVKISNADNKGSNSSSGSFDPRLLLLALLVLTYLRRLGQRAVQQQ